MKLTTKPDGIHSKMLDDSGANLVLTALVTFDQQDLAASHLHRLGSAALALRVLPTQVPPLELPLRRTGRTWGEGSPVERAINETW